MQYKPIQDIEVTEYEGDVWNLQTPIEDYVVEGIFFHNCPHVWQIDGQLAAGETCERLWMGG